MSIFHPQQLKLFKEMSANSNLAHAFLFTGPEGVGKLEFAREIAMFLQETEQAEHPDIIETLTPLPIDEAKTLKKRLYTSPFSGKYKIVIIASAHNMHTDAANSLLKMIEEPRGDTVFILVSAYPELVLATIRSRCLEVKFSYVPDQIIEKELDIKSIRDIKLHWTGRPALAKQLLNDENYKKRIKACSADCRKFMAGSLRERFNISEKYAKIEDRRDLLEALRVWMEVVRDGGEQDKKALPDILKLYKNTATTNANVRFALNNLAVKNYE